MFPTCCILPLGGGARHVASILDSDAPGCHPPLYENDPTRVSAATGEPNDDGHIWVRKPTANYGWNWGPCFTAGGILRPMLLVSYSTSAPILEDVVPVVSPAVDGGECLSAPTLTYVV